jgi:gluconate 2-dehydrogenase gamma chain
MARIIPTDDTPGATEAGTIDFLDRYLSGIDYIYAKPDGSGFEQLSGKRAEAWQQRIDAVRERYVSGVGDLDERARAAHHADFVDLAPEQQDEVLREMQRSLRALEER